MLCLLGLDGRYSTFRAGRRYLPVYTSRNRNFSIQTVPYLCGLSLAIVPSTWLRFSKNE
ncbi:protein of unknown function [Burkholderia multivorans]